MLTFGDFLDFTLVSEALGEAPASGGVTFLFHCDEKLSVLEAVYECLAHPRLKASLIEVAQASREAMECQMKRERVATGGGRGYGGKAVSLRRIYEPGWACDRTREQGFWVRVSHEGAMQSGYEISGRKAESVAAAPENWSWSWRELQGMTADVDVDVIPWIP